MHTKTSYTHPHRVSTAMRKPPLRVGRTRPKRNVLLRANEHCKIDFLLSPGDDGHSNSTSKLNLNLNSTQLNLGAPRGIKHRVSHGLCHLLLFRSALSGCRATLPSQDLVAQWPCTRYLWPGTNAQWAHSHLHRILTARPLPGYSKTMVHRTLSACFRD